MKITTFGVRISVEGCLDDEDGRRLVTTTNGRQFTAERFKFEWLPGQDGWQTRNVTVFGWVLREDGVPGHIEGMTTYWIGESATPSWVYKIVARCTPPQTPPQLTSV